MNIYDIIDSLKITQDRFLIDQASEKLLIKDWEEKQKRLKDYKELDKTLLQVQAIFQKAAEKTQKQLEFHISGLVSMALAAIWDDPYTFKVEFVQRRGKTEADLWFVKHGEKMHPLSATGGGAIDIASMALRMAFWSLTKSSIPLLFLDEPFKNLNGVELQKRASKMIKTFSEKLGIQIILITGVKRFILDADRIFNVEQVGDISRVTVQD